VKRGSVGVLITLVRGMILDNMWYLRMRHEDEAEM